MYEICYDCFAQKADSLLYVYIYIINFLFYIKVIEKKEIAWKAYPHYSTNINLDNFKLHDALYHVNAIEWAASAMEMSAIAGRNVAILAYNDLQKSRNFTDKKTSENTTKKFRMSVEL